MATSGSKSVAVTAYDTLKFNWVQVGQSTVNNYTTISWSLQLISGSAGKIISSASKSWSVTINGTPFSGTNSVAIENNTTKTLASGQVNIPHNNDGTKSFSYSFSQEFAITFAGASVGTITGSGTGTLNTIPRATTPSFHVSSIDMDEMVTIYTLRASDSFTHDLAYSFAGSDYVSIATGVETYMYWKVPLELARSIPNATSGTLTLRCITKNGTTVIGTKTALLTIKVPAALTPTIESITLTEAATGTIETIGSYVQSKSKIKAEITAVGSYGSTIKSYSSTFEGKTYNGESFTTDTVTGSGAIRLRVNITDSRGRTSTQAKDITVLAYSAPQISTFHVARYNEEGEADPDGGYAWLQLAYSVTSLNGKNTASAVIQYKKTVDTNWATLQTQTELSLNTTLKHTGRIFSTDYQWDFKITLTDAFKAEAAYSTYIPSGDVILDIRADGKGIAFFKTSTKEGVDIAGALPDCPIELTTGANLNSLTKPGFYVIPTTAISATITNKPYTDNATASIRVEQTGENAYKQILQKSSKTDGVIYERGYESDTWGAWSMVYSGAGKVLWSGGLQLIAGQSVTFSEPISQQHNGIVLVFSRYESSTARDYNYSCHFVPKQLVSTAIGAGQVAAGVLFTMCGAQFDYIAGKYVRITDTRLWGDNEGETTNKVSGTANGITYNNSGFALRYVIGV